jgi:hypothetical protein
MWDMRYGIWDGRYIGDKSHISHHISIPSFLAKDLRKIDNITA